MRTCPVPRPGGESLIFSKKPKPQPSPAQQARMIPRHLQHTSMLNTSHSAVRPRRYRTWTTLGMDAQGCTEPQGPDTETPRTALAAHTKLTRSPPKRKTRVLEFRCGKCSRAWLWERAAGPKVSSPVLPLARAASPPLTFQILPCCILGRPSGACLPAPLMPIYLSRPAPERRVWPGSRSNSSSTRTLRQCSAAPTRQPSHPHTATPTSTVSRRQDSSQTHRLAAH